MDIISAIRNLDLQFVKDLLAKQATSYNTTSSTSKELLPLHVAAETGCIEMLQLLIHHGLDVNQTDHHGSTPLQIALHHGHFDAVQFLLEQGAYINQERDENNIFTSSYNFVEHHYLKLRNLFGKRDNKDSTESDVTPSIENEPPEHIEQSQEVSVIPNDNMNTDNGINDIDNNSTNDINLDNNNNISDKENQQILTEFQPECSTAEEVPIQNQQRRNSILKPSVQTSEQEHKQVKQVQIIDDTATAEFDDPALVAKRKEALMLDAERKKSLLSKRRKSTQRKHNVGRKLR